MTSNNIMGRREFVKDTFAVAGTAVLPRFAFATEGEKKMKMAVVYYSWSLLATRRKFCRPRRSAARALKALRRTLPSRMRKSV